MTGLSNLEYHVLLALAEVELHGYAIKESVAKESAGTLAPRAGSLYRVLARLMGAGLVEEIRPKEEPGPHPGLARRYYALTEAGRRALGAEARRLMGVASIAERRLGLARSQP